MSSSNGNDANGHYVRELPMDGEEEDGAGPGLSGNATTATATGFSGGAQAQVLTFIAALEYIDS